MSYTALIAGASGLVGGYVLQYLIDDENCTAITSVGRKVLPVEAEKLEQLIIDFNQLEQQADQLKADRIFCCLGTTIKKAGSKEQFQKVDMEYPLQLARIGKEQGATVYSIVTALGASSSSSIFYNKVKGMVEDELKNIGVPSTYILQPSLLMGDRNETRFGESLAQSAFKIINPFFVGGLKKYKGIEGKQVAKAMVEIAASGKSGYHLFPSDKLLDY